MAAVRLVDVVSQRQTECTTLMLGQCRCVLAFGQGMKVTRQQGQALVCIQLGIGDAGRGRGGRGLMEFCSGVWQGVCCGTCGT